MSGAARDGPREVDAGECLTGPPRPHPAPSMRLCAPVLELADRAALHAADQHQVVRVRSPAGALFRSLPL